MRQISIHNFQPTGGQDMHQHVNPSLSFENLIVQSMYFRGKKNKYKSKQNDKPRMGNALFEMVGNNNPLF